MRIGLTAVFLCALAAAAAHAQQVEVSLLASKPFISSTGLGLLATSTNNGGKDTDVKLKGKSGYGARVTLNTRGYYGFELGYTINQASITVVDRPDANTANTSTENIKIQEAFFNFLIYFMPSGERFRPFITGGVQAYRYGSPRNIADFPGGIYKNYGANYGAGLKVNLFKHALARLDLRDYIGGKPYNLMFESTGSSGGILHQREASVGLGFTF